LNALGGACYALTMSTRTLGILGGSGLYELDGLERVRELHVETPFGEPSDALVEGFLGETRLLFLPRHGRCHRIPPHRINYRANILALKLAGAEQLVSVSAVGSMKEAIEPGHMVVVDQFIDRTRHRADTFFDDAGVVAHVSFADPVDPALAAAVYDSAVACGARVHRGGTYVCVEGPQFSTRAESHLHRAMGVDVVGMTNMPEARLAREAELPYCTLAMATDYDCWHPGHDAVSVEAVVSVMQKNVVAAKAILVATAARLPDPAVSPASRALAHAILTPPDAIAPEALERLGPLLRNRFAGRT
jgi:5'-methylthioadenosine phosphorylase